MDNEKKLCPFCGEEIDANVEKCPHCDENLKENTVENNDKTECLKECITSKGKNLCPNKCIKILLGVILIIIVFFTCSNKYKIETSEGTTYLVNQITGNVKVLEKSQIIETDKKGKIGKIEKNKLSQLKVAGTKTAKGSINCDLKYLWRDGKLYYNFKASPYNGELKKAKEKGYGGFTVLLKDANGFTIKEIPIKLNSMTRIVDSSDQVHEMEISDYITLNYDERKLITDWDLTWNF